MVAKMSPALRRASCLSSPQRYLPYAAVLCRLKRPRSETWSTAHQKFSSTQQHAQEIISLWSPRVVFGGDDEPYILTEGTVEMDTRSGMIHACFPGESKKEAKARCTTSDNNAKSFIDLSERHPHATSLCLSPGLIDVHTHISSLGRNWEGYTTATQAAAAGGITTIIGMPLNSLPPTVSAEIVEQELDFARNQSQLYANVGLWGGVLPDTAPEQLRELLSHQNILGLKAFLSPLPRDAGYQAVSPEQFLKVAEICGSFDNPMLVHSELMTTQGIEAATEQAFPADGSRDNSYAAHVRSRPPEWEQEAVKLVVEATKYCDIHVVHLSDALGCLPIIEAAKQNDKTARRLTVETCPHYLLLDTTNIKDGDTRVKCFPPIREPEQREALWKGLEWGLIDMIASDHSPCEPRMRSQSIRNAWGGLTGLQYQLPATWTAAKQIDGVTVTEIDMAKWWSRNPARLARLKHSGSIEPGKRCDFVVWDTEHVDAPDNYSKEYHRWKGDCYYASQRMNGRVLETWLGGSQVYDGELLCEKGSYIKHEGRF